MPDDSFENRLRALAEQLSRSLSDADIDGVAERLGVDPDRVRGAADAANTWLSDRAREVEPLFGATAPPPAAYEPATARPGGPHPLETPTESQGRALAALDAGRWTVRPGANRLSGSAVGGEPPENPDLVGELRARDWIGADGGLTLLGHRALERWARAGEAREATRTQTPPPPPAAA